MLIASSAKVSTPDLNAPDQARAPGQFDPASHSHTNDGFAITLQRQIEDRETITKEALRRHTSSDDDPSESILEPEGHDIGSLSDPTLMMANGALPALPNTTQRIEPVSTGRFRADTDSTSDAHPGERTTSRHKPTNHSAATQSGIMEGHRSTGISYARDLDIAAQAALAMATLAEETLTQGSEPKRVSGAHNVLSPLNDRLQDIRRLTPSRVLAQQQAEAGPLANERLLHKAAIRTDRSVDDLSRFELTPAGQVQLVGNRLDYRPLTTQGDFQGDAAGHLLDPTHGAATARGAPEVPAGAVRSGHIAHRFDHANWGEALSRQLLSWTTGVHKGGMHAELYLTPPETGPLRVKIEIVDSVTTASFASAHAGVRAALETAMPQLQAAMAKAGILLGDAHIQDSNAGTHSERHAWENASHENRDDQRDNDVRLGAQVDWPSSNLPHTGSAVASDAERKKQGMLDVFA